MVISDVLEMLKEKSRPEHLEGMKRFGIDVSRAWGIKIPELRRLARSIPKDHQFALALWETQIHEARILASMVDDPALVTRAQINHWVRDFRSWDVCDQVCGNLFDRSPYAVEYAVKFSNQQQEFVKRAAFVLTAESAVHLKTASDDVFADFLPLIEREAWDDRNFVKKAVNWALRQIGKRSKALRPQAIACAERILLQEYPSAKWIARDALRELRDR